MDDREQLLDQLGLVFARAAVDALLLEQEAETATPATSAKGAGVWINGNSRNSNSEKSTRRASAKQMG